VKTPRLLSLSLIFVLILASSARAGWGWKMPNLNPFKSHDSHPAHVAENNRQGAGWRWPGMEKKPAVEQPASPSMWQRMSSAPKYAWTKTKTTLNPWAARPAPPQQPISVTGTNSHFARMTNANSKQPAKKPMWAWGAEEDNEKPRKASSVSDFIGGQRPE
jgi:hypothetical protein